MAKKYDELTFNDDFMFCKILEQNPAICRELLELILDRKVGELASVNPQKPIEITANGKFVGSTFLKILAGTNTVFLICAMKIQRLSWGMKLKRYSCVRKEPKTTFQRNCWHF